MERAKTDKAFLAEGLSFLRLPKMAKRIADFLKSGEGIEAFVRTCQDAEGARLIASIGQTREGRMVATRMIITPAGWKACYQILKRLGESRVRPEDRPARLPSIDLSDFSRSGAENLRGLAKIMKDPDTAHNAFVSFSESKANAALCARGLEDRKVRESVYEHIMDDPKRTIDTFMELFGSKERRILCSDIFMSSGGTKLLAELAHSDIGRMMLATLALTDEGREIGFRVLARHPATILRVGINYFRMDTRKDEAI